MAGIRSTLFLLLLATGCWLLALPAAADLPPLVVNTTGTASLQGFIEFLVHEDSLSREQLVQGHYDGQFQRYDDPQALRNNKGIWLRFNVTNSSNTDDLVISMADILYNEVELIYYQEGRLYQEFLGIQYPYAYQKTGYHDIAFFVRQPVNSTKTYFIRFTTDYPLLLDGFVTTLQTYAQKQSSRTAGGFLLIGTTIGIVLYLAMIAMYLRHFRELWHCLAFAFTTLAVLLFGRGILFNTLPHNPWVNSHLYSIIFIALTIAFVSFSRHHFNTKLDFPVINKAFIGTEAALVALLASSLFAPITWTATLIQTMAFFLIFFLCLTSVYIWSNSQRRLTLYVFGTLAFLFTSILAAAENNGLINIDGNMGIAFEIGICLQTVLFALATAQNINEHQQKETAKFISIAIKKTESRINNSFLAKMSHELRTPMNGLLGLLNLLDDTPLNNQQKHYTNIMRNSGSLLLGVIDDVLDYSRIVSGNFPIERKNFDLATLADELSSVFSESAKAKQISLSVNLNGTGPFIVCGDRIRLRQILVNLISNAIKFTNKGNVHVRLTLTKDSDTQWRIFSEVEDTGKGINSEYLSEIFREKNRDRSALIDHGSSGLGLVICQNLVSLMNGEIDVESAPGYGALFRFHIRVSPPVHESGPSDESRSIHAPAHRTERYHVLIADDNDTSREIMKTHLAKAGIQPVFASNGEEAIQLYCDSDTAWDLVFMDTEMPIMDGYRAATEIRTWESRHYKNAVPIIAMTIHSGRGVESHVIQYGMDDILGKPVTEEQLQGILKRWLQQSDHINVSKNAKP